MSAWHYAARPSFAQPWEGRCPNDLTAPAIETVGLCQIYTLLEDAYTSYWKRYATAAFPSEHIVHFVPTGGELDVRLGQFTADDELFRADIHQNAPGRDLNLNSLDQY